MRILVIGDIHGAYKALVQVLERANYDPTKDRIITLGDVSDGWPDTKRVVDFLTTKCTFGGDIHCIGNHDEWTHEWIKYGVAQPHWLNQGGRATFNSYVMEKDERGCIPPTHAEFFRKQVPFHLNRDLDFVFVHAGWPNAQHRVDVNRVSDEFWWTREFWSDAQFFEEGKYTPHKRVFIGHTTIGDSPPEKRAEVWNLDTGGGYEGRVTVMDAETEEFWQSDPVRTFYPNHKHR